MNAAKLAAVAAVLLAAWFFRFALVVVPAGGQGIVGPAYMINRWTGTVYIITPSSVRELTMAAPSQPQQ